MNRRKPGLFDNRPVSHRPVVKPTGLAPKTPRLPWSPPATQRRPGLRQRRAPSRRTRRGAWVSSWKRRAATARSRNDDRNRHSTHHYPVIRSAEQFFDGRNHHLSRCPLGRTTEKNCRSGKVTFNEGGQILHTRNNMGVPVFSKSLHWPRAGEDSDYTTAASVVTF